MLERYFVRPDTVDRIRSSWIGGAVDQYVTWLSERNFSGRSVSRRVPILIKFGDHARAQGATTWADLPAHIDSFVASWLESRVQGPKSSQSLRKLAKDLRNPIQQMLRLILPDFEGTRRPVKPENPFQELAPDFFVYLRQEKGLRESSILHYSHYLRQFAIYLESIGLTDLRHLSPPVL
jgi:integrase/recombinase XerD